jgi:hypothetical protein
MAAAIFVIYALTIALIAGAAVVTAVANAVTAAEIADADVDAEIIVVINRMYCHSFILDRFGWVSGFAGPAFLIAIRSEQ